MVQGTRKRGHAAAGGPALLGNRSLGKCAPPDPPGHSDGGGGGGVDGDGGSAAALLDALGLGSFARLELPARRPDLFSEVDGMSPEKRRKCLILQQDEKSLHGNSIKDQPKAAEAEVEEKLVSGQSKNIGKMPAFGYAKDQQRRTETEDQEDGKHWKDVSVGPSFPSFHASRQQVLAHVENALLETERTSAHIRAEIQHMKEMAKEKDNQIAYIKKETQKELHAMLAKISQLEHDKMLMCSILHGCKKMLQQSSAAFLEYRKMVNEGSGGVSSLDAVADEKNQGSLMQEQQRCAYEIINGLQKPLLSKFLACAKNIRVLIARFADLSNQVQRLKCSRSVPDLNVV